LLSEEVNVEAMPRALKAASPRTHSEVPKGLAQFIAEEFDLLSANDGVLGPCVQHGQFWLLRTKLAPDGDWKNPTWVLLVQSDRGAPCAPAQLSMLVHPMKQGRSCLQACECRTGQFCLFL